MAKPPGMTEHEASRTLVKSPPELWAECSEAASLARHLGQFGEIRITRLEPETAVAWEGEEVSGTVRLEPMGWGTKVILTARRPQLGGSSGAQSEPPVSELAPREPRPAPEPAEEPGPVREAEVPDPAPNPPRSSKRGAVVWLRDFFGFGRVEEPLAFAPAPSPAWTAPMQPVEVEVPRASEPEPESELIAVVEPVDEAVAAADQALSAALDSLGQAHHRPFSRG